MTDKLNLKQKVGLAVSDAAAQVVTSVSKTAETLAKTGEKITKTAADTAAKSTEIAADTGLTAAEGVGKAVAKTATEITEKTGEAAVKINAALGDAASALVLSNGKLAVNITESASEGTKDLTKISFDGVNEIAKNSFGIISGVFSALSSTAKITSDAISHQIKESRDLKNIRLSIEQNGFSEPIKHQIRKEVINIVNNSIETLESIRSGLILALNDTYSDYRKLIKCRESYSDLYYSNNMITSQIYDVCKYIDVPISKNSKKTMRISPVSHINKIINDIKLSLNTGATLEEAKCELMDIPVPAGKKTCSIVGFNRRIVNLNTLRNTFPVISGGKNAVEAYDSFWENFTSKVDSLMNIDDISLFFNYKIRSLNMKMKENLSLLNPGEDVAGGKRRRSRRKVSKRRRNQKSGGRRRTFKRGRSYRKKCN